MKALFTIITGLLLTPALATASDTPCFIEVAKAACWQGYEVTIQLKDAPSQQNIGAPIVLSKTTANTIQQFACTPNQQITAEATFSPAIWQGSDKTTYHLKKFWTVPTKFPAGTTKWSIRTCFAGDFVAVPAPPQGNTPCVCTFPDAGAN